MNVSVVASGMEVSCGGACILLRTSSGSVSGTLVWSAYERLLDLLNSLKEVDLTTSSLDTFLLGLCQLGNVTPGRVVDDCDLHHIDRFLNSIKYQSLTAVAEFTAQQLGNAQYIPTFNLLSCGITPRYEEP